MAKTLDAAGVKRLIQEIKGANKNLNTPIPISTENTPESMAQNVKNIADYVEKAKAAGIASANGMAVTCLIDYDYSVVGCLYGEGVFVGILLYDDNSLSYVLISNGSYTERSVVVEEATNQVTSSMLVEGARKPIILTPSTTEVDEETYQKLLSNDVDVVFITSDDEYCQLTYKYNGDTTLKFYFTALSAEGGSLQDAYLYGYEMSINNTAPHKATVKSLFDIDIHTLIDNSGFINKSILSPVFQEIDLSGTDADRKAKLDKFETYWKDLTGAGDLEGARFVGKVEYDNGDIIELILTKCQDGGDYMGIAPSGSSDKPYEVYLSPNGSLLITPLFSHLEAITIYTDNTPEHMQANLDNIAAYEANLQGLGVTNVDGIMIPIKFEDDPENIATTFPFSGYVTKYSSFYDGIVSTLNGAYKPRVITINGQQGEDGGKVVFETITLEKQLDNYTPKSLDAKSLEAITIKTDNTPDAKAANVAAIKAYVDILIALGVDMTKGYMIPICFSNTELGYVMYHPFSTGSEYTGIITGPGGASANIAIEKDGYAYVTTHIQPVESSLLTTTAGTIVPAINEVNALAKGYSTIFTPIELTTETAQNKTAIDARVAAFTVQGISLTNGCCIPVTYKGVYAGNISFINGDWYGLLVKNTNNPADNINIKLSADGTIAEGNSAQ